MSAARGLPSQPQTGARPRSTSAEQTQAPAPLPMFHRVLPADPPAIRGALRDLTARFQDVGTLDALGRLELVLAEVLNNLAQHATGRGKGAVPPGPTREVTIHLCITRHDGGLACAVTDDGPPLPKGCIDPGCDILSPDDAALRGSGFGWLIIRDLTQALFHFREGKRNVLCFNVPF